MNEINSQRIVFSLTEQGIPLEADELDIKFFQARPHDHEVILEMSRNIPDPVDPQVLEWHTQAHTLKSDSDGFGLVRHWLRVRSIARYYPTDVLGIIGLSMIHHPDVIMAGQGLVNEIERHRLGVPPKNFAELQGDLSEPDFRSMLCSARFNLAEDMIYGCTHHKAIYNIKKSLSEGENLLDEARVIDRYVLLAVAANRADDAETLEECRRQIESLEEQPVSQRLALWTPKFPDLESIFSGANL